MPSQGVNFRQTSDFVTDGADEIFTFEAGGYSETYETIRDGISFGWDVNNVSTRDRNSGVDVRLAGTHFRTDQPEFRLDLDDLNGSGLYTITAAFGDEYGNQAVYVQLLDDTTVFATINGTTTGAERFFDAAGNAHSTANWPGSNSTIDRTFTSEILRIRSGDGASTNGFVAHINLEWTAGVGINTIIIVPTGPPLS